MTFMKPNLFPPCWLFELNRQLQTPFTATEGVWCGTDAIALLASAEPRPDEPGLVDVRIALTPEAIRLQLPATEGNQMTAFFKLGLKPSKPRASRVAACMALGKLTTSAAQVELRKLVENEADELVRTAAVNALRNLERPVVEQDELTGVPLRLVIPGDAGETIVLEQVTDAAGLAVFPSVPATASCQLQWVVPLQFSGLWPLVEGLRLVASQRAVLENENWRVQLDFEATETSRSGDLVVEVTPLSPTAEAEPPPRLVVEGGVAIWQPSGDWRENKMRFHGIPATQAALRVVPAQLYAPAGEERSFAALSPPDEPPVAEAYHPVVVQSPEQGLVSLLERTADGRVRVTVETESPNYAEQTLICSLGGAHGKMMLASVKEGVWRGTVVLKRAWAGTMLGAVRYQLANVAVAS